MFFVSICSLHVHCKSVYYVITLHLVPVTQQIKNAVLITWKLYIQDYILTFFIY